MDWARRSTTLALTHVMPKLLRCQTCRLSWFPQGGPATVCPACGGSHFGGALQLFHVGILLIAVAVGGWAWPYIGQIPGVERIPLGAPAAEPSKKPAVAKVEDHRVLTQRRVGQVHVPSKKAKKRQKAKTRSKYVQR
jgi:hypothetical protein